MHAALSAIVLAALAASSVSAETVVSVVRSDDPALPAPAAPNQALDYAQHIRPLVRRAVEQAGLRELVQAATPGRDGVVDVVCKVNIVHVDHIQGDITDARVVKAIFQAVHEWAPAARLTVAEGGVWVPPERTDILAQLDYVEVGDGFEAGGFRAILQDPDLAGADLRIVDLNYDDTVERVPPGGGLVHESYHVPRTIADAEILIDVPVLKITGAVGMTVAVKNLIGIAPGTKYGWSKSRGWPPGSDNTGLWHTARTLDETIVDLAGVAGVDFAVVDAIVGMEKGRIAADGGRPVRLNTVLAGADLFAVDAVAARLMGMNPDDMEFLHLGTRRGLGVGRLEDIRVHGDLEGMVHRFEKHPADWGINGQYGHYGMSNRTWLLRGPLSNDEQDAIAPDVVPIPGVDGWSDPVYFHDDKIDLDRYYDDPTHCVVFAYGEFDAPRDEPGELWVGSDEGIEVWLDGDRIYRYAGRRRHRLPNERVRVDLRQGRHRVLVRAHQQRGAFDFSLKFCEVETDPRYDGNAVFGLRWRVPNPADVAVAEVRVIGDDRDTREQWFEAHEVHLTEPRRTDLSAFLPWLGRAPWVRFEAPHMWSDELWLSAEVTESAVVVTTDNVAAFRLMAEGPLGAGSKPRDIVVDSLTVGVLDPGVDEVRVAADQDGGWTVSRAEPIDWDIAGFVGQAGEHIGREPSPPTWDSPLGNWFCDAIRFGTGADVAFQNNGGIRADLEHDAVSVRDVFRMNFRDQLYTFEMTGTDLLAALEHDLRDAKPAPMQVSGLRYTFDRSRPEGERIVEHDLEPARTYTVAAEDYLCQRGVGFLGREVAWTNTGVQIVDAQIRYVAATSPVMAPAVGRIRELSPE